MLRWHRISTPIGELSLASDGAALARVAFPGEYPPASDAAEGTEGSEGTDAVLDTAVAWLDDYFAGTIRGVDVPLALDGDTFTRRAQRALTSIAPGQTRTYAWLAGEAGSPVAVRAAGSACAGNPLPLFVPCHRVVRADGAIGNYRGGRAAKKWLLDHERKIAGTEPGRAESNRA